MSDYDTIYRNRMGVSEILTFIECASILMLYHLLFIGDTENIIKKHSFVSIIGGIIGVILFTVFKEFGTIAIILILLLGIIVTCKVYKKNIIVNMAELIISSIILIVVELIFTIVIKVVAGNVDAQYWRSCSPASD